MNYEEFQVKFRELKRLALEFSNEDWRLPFRHDAAEKIVSSTEEMTELALAEHFALYRGPMWLDIKGPEALKVQTEIIPNGNKCPLCPGYYTKENEGFHNAMVHPELSPKPFYPGGEPKKTSGKKSKQSK